MSVRCRNGGIGFVLLLASSLAVTCSAQDAASPVEGALADSVWYDADRGEVIPIHVEPVVDDSLNRNSRWLPKAKRVRQTTTLPTPGGGALGGGTGAPTGLFGSGLTIGNLFGWVLLLAVVAVLIGTLIYAMSRTEVDLTGTRGSKSDDLLRAPDEQTLERMKHLPAELRRTDVNLRTEAERLMKEGRYDQAIILLFGHQLLLLDRVGMLRLNRGKTNRRYVRETRSTDAATANRLASTVGAFERSYFGRHEITRTEFAELWQSNAKLEQSVQRLREVAA